MLTVVVCCIGKKIPADLKGPPEHKTFFRMVFDRDIVGLVDNSRPIKKGTQVLFPIVRPREPTCQKQSAPTAYHSNGNTEVHICSDKLSPSEDGREFDNQ